MIFTIHEKPADIPQIKALKPRYFLSKKGRPIGVAKNGKVTPYKIYEKYYYEDLAGFDKEGNVYILYATMLGPENIDDIQEFLIVKFNRDLKDVCALPFGGIFTSDLFEGRFYTVETTDDALELYQWTCEK